MINIEAKKQTDPRKNEQSPKIENKHKVAGENVHKHALKPNQKVEKPKPADKDHTNHSAENAREAKPAKAQQDEASIEAQPVKMSWAHVVKKEVSKLAEEKPKTKPKVS